MQKQEKKEMENEVTMRLQEIIYKCQAWVDNETYVPKRFKAKSWSEEFAEIIVRELEAVMIREKFSFQSDKIYLPTFYFIQISPEDSREFFGTKRDILSENLNKFVGRCFGMLSIESKRQQFVQIAANPKLQKGEIEIRHQWEESYQPSIQFHKTTVSDDFSEDTIIAEPFWKTDSEIETDEECETVVGKRIEPIYCLEIKQGENPPRKLPIYQKEIVIGRGSPSLPVDVRLAEDFEISRHHAVLRLRTDDIFNLSILGQNAALIAETYLIPGQTAFLKWGDEFQIGSYLLGIQK